MKHLVLSLVFVLLGSYQSVFAGDNGFSARSIRVGDNVITLLRKHGFNTSEREKILRSAPGLLQVFLTTDMTYLAGRSGLRIFDAQKDVVYSIDRKGRELAIKSEAARFQVRTLRQSGQIRGSLMSSLLAKIPSNWVASRFMDAYILEHDLESLAAGAKFSLLVEKKYSNGAFVKYGEVLKTELEINGQVIRKDFIRFQSGGVFIGSRDMLSEKAFYAPVSYLRVASLFQPDRRHPITRRVQPHLGVDFELPEGSPVIAPRTGVVVRMGRNRVAGNYIVLLHNGGVETSYNHLRRIEPGLREGTRLRTGQRIGEIGCTGYCTRAHLHFAVKIKGRMVNPAKHLKAFPAPYEESLQARIAAQ